MVQEVDQAAVDVIKTLLESQQGRLFMMQYLKDSLTMYMDVYHSQLHILFDDVVVCTASLRIESKFM